MRRYLPIVLVVAILLVLGIMLLVGALRGGDADTNSHAPVSGLASVPTAGS